MIGGASLGKQAMSASLTGAAQLLASVGLGLLIGLGRERAHKELGGRSFAITALLGTLAWLVSPAFVLAEVGIVVVMIVLVNYTALRGPLLSGFCYGRGKCMHVLCCLDGTSGERVSRVVSALLGLKERTVAVLYVTDTGPREEKPDVKRFVQAYACRCSRLRATFHIWDLSRFW